MGTWQRVGTAVLASLALLPFVTVLSVAVPVLEPVESWLRPWFNLQCERDPARTLRLAGVPLAVCARCSGIYFGLGLGAALRVPHLSARALRAWVLLAAAAMLADVGLERRGLHGSQAWLRVATGLLLAYPVGVGLGRWLLRAPRSEPHSP